MSSWFLFGMAMGLGVFVVWFYDDGMSRIWFIVLKLLTRI